MQIPNLSLAYLVAELKPLLDGSILRKVQELDNSWLKMRFQTKQGTKDLIAAPDAVFLTSYSMPAKQTTSGYGAFLRKKLANKKVLALEQHGFDRILVMELEGFFLIFELFAKGNVILTDEKKTILSAFRKEQWKDRKKGNKNTTNTVFPAQRATHKVQRICFRCLALTVARCVLRNLQNPVLCCEHCLKLHKRSGFSILVGLEISLIRKSHQVR